MKTHSGIDAMQKEGFQSKRQLRHPDKIRFPQLRCGLPNVNLCSRLCVAEPRMGEEAGPKAEEYICCGRRALAVSPESVKRVFQIQREILEGFVDPEHWAYVAQHFARHNAIALKVPRKDGVTSEAEHSSLVLYELLSNSEIYGIDINENPRLAPATLYHDFKEPPIRYQFHEIARLAGGDGEVSKIVKSVTNTGGLEIGEFYRGLFDEGAPIPIAMKSGDRVVGNETLISPDAYRTERLEKSAADKNILWLDGLSAFVSETADSVIKNPSKLLKHVAGSARKFGMALGLPGLIDEIDRTLEKHGIYSQAA